MEWPLELARLSCVLDTISELPGCYEDRSYRRKSSSHVIAPTETVQMLAEGQDHPLELVKCEIQTLRVKYHKHGVG